MQEEITRLYTTDDYLVKNPGLHEEDSQWKVSKLGPLVDAFLVRQQKDEIILLDVGGGAGAILAEIADMIRQHPNISVKKYALDLSPGALELQRARNPDIVKAMREDIRKTSLVDKEVDLALMIDVLEHVPEPNRALEELKRIAKFVIFKVPIEKTIWTWMADFVRGPQRKQEILANIGHVNFYTPHELRSQIESDIGRIVEFRYANSFQPIRSTKLYSELGLFQKLPFIIGPMLFKISPGLCLRIFVDSALFLVECY
jgi:SAM-dependent methyltransferase